MSKKYYFTVDGVFKSILRLKNKLEYDRWVDAIEQYSNITWDYETKHGKYFLLKDRNFYYKKQVYFDYSEIEQDYDYEANQLLKTGKYSFFISYNEELGVAYAQFFGKERKDLLPILWDIAKKMNCFLVKGGDKLITQKYIDKLVNE